MLACIPHTMSRKRRGISFATPGQLGMPKTKRSREDNTTSQNKGFGGERIKENQSLDLVVFSRSRSRRLASVKAQIAVSTLLSAEHPRSRSSSPYGSTTEEDEEVMIVDSPWSGSETNQPARPHKFDRKISQSSFKKGAVKGNRNDSCSSSLSPLSSVGSELDEERMVHFPAKSSPPKIKSPVLSLVPVIECKKVVSNTKAKKPATQEPLSLNGYVRRMASLNARACVSAMMEPMRRPSKPKTQPPAPSVPTSPAVKSPTKSDQNERSSPRRSPVPQPTAVGVVTRSRQSSAEREVVESIVTSPPPSSRYVLVCALPVTLKEYGIIQSSYDRDSEDSTVNAEGLLWNGDTVHPQSPVYLTPDGSMPRLIVPPVRPATLSSVREAKICVRTHHAKKRKKPTTVKGDNGWSVLGNPIKTVLLPQEDGTKVRRKYYIGMRRKNEEIFARDCITVRAGKKKQDSPYIAKIGSIWKEDKGGLMVTLFWYYRPEETAGIQSKDFQQDELLASQHYDDNSVACIEDKCFVLGITQYCRYRALCRSATEHISSSDSFSVVHHDSNEKEQFGLGPVDTVYQSDDLVFLCYRGYNHIAGKLLKSHKH